MPILAQTLSLALAMTVISISWYFDKMFMSQLLAESFSIPMVSVLALIAATVFSGGRLLLYAWTFSKEKLGFFKRVWFAAGSITLLCLSLSASLAIIAKSLDSPNLDAAISQQKTDMRDSYKPLIKRVDQNAREQTQAVDARFDRQVAEAKAPYTLKEKEPLAIMARESKRTYKASAGADYVGRYEGPIYMAALDKLNAIREEMRIALMPIEQERRLAHQAIATERAAEKRRFDKELQEKLATINPDSVKNTRASNNPFVASISRLFTNLGMPVTYEFLSVFFTALCAVAIELLTAASVASYVINRQNQKTHTRVTPNDGSSPAPAMYIASTA